MKNRAIWISTSIGTLLGAFVTWMVCHVHDRPLSGIQSEELRIAIANLSNQNLLLSNDLRNYLKARVYVNVIRGVQADGFVDFGPIDDNSLSDIQFTKSPESADTIYKLAIKQQKEFK